MNPYECPPRTAPAEDRLGWLKRTKSQSMAWLQTNKSYVQFADAIRTLEYESADDDTLPASLSNVNAGEVRRDARELIATMANLKATASFKCDNNQMYDVANILNRMYNAWFYATRPSRKYKGQFQMASATGTGWACPEWDPDFYRQGRGEITMRIKGPHEVLPVQLPSDGDYQKAYAVHVIEEMPIAMAHRKWPLLTDRIKADRDSPSWVRKGLQKFQEFLSPVLELFGGQRTGMQSDPIFPTVDVHFTYIRDDSVNNTGQILSMGEPGTNYEYTVPYVGMDIPSGMNDPNSGAPLYRKATFEDAKLYPMRRRIIWCNSGMIDDNSSPFWHGKFPGVPFSFDKWVWDPIGKPLTYGVANLERSMTRLMRAIDDSANTRLDPPLVASEQLSDDYKEGFSCRIPGQMLTMTSITGEPIKPLLPADFYNLPPFIADWVKYLEARIQRNMGVLDVQALARSAQVPSQDTLEKIKELAGPIIQDMTDDMEAMVAGVGDQWMWLAFQFYTVKRRVQVLGDTGLTAADFDFDPGVMVPSHLPGENTQFPSRMSQIDRAKWFAGQFYFFVEPGSMLKITSIMRKLLFIQLAKAGVPIDRWTMADVFEVPNYGPPPDGTRNVQERLVAEERMKEEAARRMAVQMGVLNEDGTPGPAAPNQGGAGAAGAGGEKNPVGRPPTGLQPPHVEIKDGGQRSTIAQS